MSATTPVVLFENAVEARVSRSGPRMQLGRHAPSARATQIAHLFGLLQINGAVADDVWMRLQSAAMIELLFPQGRSTITLSWGRTPVMSIAHRFARGHEWDAKLRESPTIRRRLPALLEGEVPWDEMFESLAEPPDLPAGTRVAFTSLEDGPADTWLGEVRPGGAIPFVAASERHVRVGLFSTVPVVMERLQYSIDEISDPDRRAAPPDVPDRQP